MEMILGGLKYFVIALVFGAVYFLARNIRPGQSEELRNKLDRLRHRFLQSAEAKPGRGSTGVDLEKLQRLAMAAAGAGACLGFLLAGADFSDPTAYLVAACLGLCGFYTPRMMLAMQVRQRRQKLEAQLPDALELISGSLRAGLSLVQALEVVARESQQPTAAEFGECVRDVRLGLAPEEALEKLNLHWKNADLELFVVAAGVSRRTGGNLAEVSGRIIATIRERVRLKGRIAALTAQGKMSGWVVGLLPVFLLLGLCLLDPRMMSGFFHHPLGWGMLLLGAGMEAAGAFFIFKIVDIDI